MFGRLFLLFFKFLLVIIVVDDDGVICVYDVFECGCAHGSRGNFRNLLSLCILLKQSPS